MTKRLTWFSATGHFVEIWQRMMRICGPAIGLLIVVGLTGNVACAQFSAFAAVQDTLGCNQTTGLLPQTNFTAAVTSCQDQGGAGYGTNVPGAATVMTAGGYPSIGMVDTEALVESNLSYAASATASAYITDTYWPNYIPPNTILLNGGVLLTLSVNGFNNLSCMTSASYGCSNDFAQTSVTVNHNANIQVLYGTTTDAIGRDHEIFYNNGPQSSHAAVSQGFQFYIPWQGGNSPSGLIAPFLMQLDSAATCNYFDTDSCFTWTAFKSTLKVTHADVVDASGNIIPGATVATASGFNPNASQQMVFSNFTGKLDITIGPPSSFDFNGSFTLGSGSTDINPPATGLTLSVGSFSVLVPVNSFVETKKGAFVYEGTIGGGPLEFRINPTSTTNPKSYSVQVEARDLNNFNTTKPVPIKLVIGTNVGNTQINAEFQ